MNNNHTTISITAGTIIKTILLVLLLVFLYIMRDLALVLLTAVVIASSIEPITKWFVNYHIPRVPAVILIYLIIALVFAAIVFFFIPPLVNEMSGILSLLSKYIQGINISSSGGNFFGGQGLLGTITENVSLIDVVTNFKNTFSGFSGGIVNFASLIFGGASSFILIVVISFYLAVQENGIQNFLRIITPANHEKYLVDLWKRSQQKIGLWLQGQMLLGLLIGVLVYLGLTVLGIKYALLLALLAAIFEIIPLFGPILAATPAVILGFLEGIVPGFMVLGFYIIIQQFENHLIYPLVVQKVVGVPPLVVIIALIVGVKLAGVLGLLLAAPLAAVLMEYVNDVEKRKLLA